MQHPLFSYAYYVDLIRTLQKLSPLKDFKDITTADEAFFILRHDVEFSVERAFELAKLEHEALKITSSYFFQVRNNTYNVLSRQNIALIKKIHDLGHAIGLHVNFAELATFDDMSQFIQRDVTLLSQTLDLPVDRFSFHRPTVPLLEAHLHINGLINAYAPAYFQYDEHFAQKELAIYYFSDSEHRWKYGHPTLMRDKKTKKFQLLIHPYSWSLHGADNVNNFKQLIKQKVETMLCSMQSECHHFPRELLHDEKI